MKTQARVVVIGGGVVGVSTLYHLAKKGWSDVVLIERKELTSGSTWHAAGLLPLVQHELLGRPDPQIFGRASTSELRGRDRPECRLHASCSNIRLARTKDRWDEFMYYAGVAETIGVKVNVLTPEQVKEVWPLCETDGIIGAIQHPDDGYIQPADLTQALAKGARNRGRRDLPQHHGHRHRADAVRRMAGQDRQGRHHLPSTSSRATGNFARQTGAMVGLDVPVIPVEHQYIVTEPHPAIQERQSQGLPEMGVLREADSSWYMREENGGLLLGPYEKGAPCCYVDGPRTHSPNTSSSRRISTG